MTRDNSGQNTGQSRDIRDATRVPVRDIGTSPLIGGCPCPETGRPTGRDRVASAPIASQFTGVRAAPIVRQFRPAMTARRRAWIDPPP
jgi:hypothetical protein